MTEIYRSYEWHTVDRKGFEIESRKEKPFWANRFES